MVRSPSRVFFPLESNAYSLLAGAPVAEVRRRLKVSALFFEEVYVEAGIQDVTAGPGLAMNGWTPATEVPNLSFQSAADRAKRRAKGLEVVIHPRPEDVGRQSQRIRSDAPIAWKATFEPFRTEIGDRPWLHFGAPVEAPLDVELVRRWDEQDLVDPQLTSLMPDSIVRHAVVGGVNRDLVAGARLRAAISIDALHRPILARRVIRGEASAVPGERALAILFPCLDDLGWPDICEARGLPHLQSLRAFLADLETEVRANSLRDVPFAAALRQEYNERLRLAAEALTSRWSGRLMNAAVGFIAGELTGLVVGVPLVGGVVGTVAALGVEQTKIARSHPHWLSTDIALRRLPSRRIAA